MKTISKVVLFIVVATAGARTANAQSVITASIYALECYNTFNSSCNTGNINVMGYTGTFEIDGYATCTEFYDYDYVGDTSPFASAAVYEGCGNGTVDLYIATYPDGANYYDEDDNYVEADTISASAYYQNPDPVVWAESDYVIDCTNNTISSYYTPPFSCP